MAVAMPQIIYLDSAHEAGETLLEAVGSSFHVVNKGDKTDL